ncbi:EAL domain-containing protein [uncultured Clostridium sp.]|uniref:EAL domain-containing protein n=1 Tax=uncultured Clostridium sp. TaxID=59620 RepID=UPI0025D82018|nr:EAL domain-containing protein [uncultured Clostridium sp.]
MWLLSALLIFIFSVLIWNAGKLHVILSDNTELYLSDVTTHMTAEIGESMRNKMTSLELISCSISQIGPEQGDGKLQEFLDRNAAMLDFRPLILIDRQGSAVSSSVFSKDLVEKPEEFFDAASIQASFHGETRANYVGGKWVFYSVPVYHGEKIEGVLVGIRDKEKMQSMISSKNFRGQMLSCIVDSGGQVVISPTDLNRFLQLEDIFRDEKEQKAIAAIRNMQKDMKNGEDGILHFNAVDGQETFMSYNALGVNDWFVLTLIPADIISGDAQRYIFRSLGVLGITILVFFLLLHNVYRFYNMHRKQLEYLAFFDPITDGSNNIAFQLKYRELSKTMKPRTYTIVLLDVSGFKMVNERFGIEAGNRILSHIAAVLDRHMKAEAGEFSARGETDHYFLCLREHEPETVRKRLDEMIHDINQFNEEELRGLHLSFRQGACLVEDPKQEITLLQDRARISCRNSNPEVSGECIFYDDALILKIKKEQELNSLFDQSLEEHDFQVYLQPKVRLESGKPEGAEALVRWNHPQKGMIYPSDFIPLFEQNGKICRLDLYVYTEVCILLNRWRREGRELIPISVNLSRQHFKEPDFLDRFAEIAGQYEIPGGMIEFELTESIFFNNSQIHLVKEAIDRMHALGFLCSLDDFGSGFSSLGLLKEFDVDTLKLDRSFFVNMDGEKAKDVITCLIELSKRLKVQTVAEGIEEEEQLEYLRGVRCDMVQGYVFSRPLPAGEFEKWLYGN